MSRIVRVILIYHRHKPINLLYDRIWAFPLRQRRHCKASNSSSSSGKDRGYVSPYLNSNAHILPVLL
jgi:hypothetical protein